MSTPVNEVELPNLDAMMSEESKIEEIEHEESKNVEKSGHDYKQDLNRFRE